MSADTAPAHVLALAHPTTPQNLSRFANLLTARRKEAIDKGLYATGLRLAEITRIRCEDLEPVEYQLADGSMPTDWLLSVIGKGGRSHQVPVPAELVEEVGDELARHGFERQVNAVSNQDIAVLAILGTERQRPSAWSASGLYEAIKALLA